MLLGGLQELAVILQIKLLTFEPEHPWTVGPLFCLASIHLSHFKTWSDVLSWECCLELILVDFRLYLELTMLMGVIWETWQRGQKSSWVTSCCCWNVTLLCGKLQETIYYWWFFNCDHFWPWGQAHKTHYFHTLTSL